MATAKKNNKLKMIKLNLGSGSKIKDGYINVDKYDTFKTDIVHDFNNKFDLN